MYLYQFEQIVRAAVVRAGGPEDWALPYWNYEGPGQSNQIPPAFREAQLPDGSPNPLLVQARRPGINTGGAIPPTVTTSVEAMSASVYTTPAGGAPVGFGGPRTGFAHFGPAAGALENQPHNIMHVVVGGNTGLMTNPDTAALDPIFWLHHANIDRLWETWRLTVQANPDTRTWLGRSFRLRNDVGKTVRMKVGEVVDTQDLDYTYDSLPAVASTPRKREKMPRPSRPTTVAQNDTTMTVGRDGASTSLTLGPLPTPGAGASNKKAPQFHLKLAEIEGRVNPGIIYGVYVNLPDDADEATSEARRVGLVSFFGVEHSTDQGSDSPQPLTYNFDITELITQLGAHGNLDQLQVALLPMPGLVEDPPVAASTPPPVQIGTVSVLTS
jgi:hypothetical protein